MTVLKNQTSPPPILKLTGICKAFGGVQALDEVDFDLMPGEVHALVGENGAGKSTLIKIITGAHVPDAGEFIFDGQSIDRLDPLAARALGIAAIYQQPALFPDLSVAENIAFGISRPKFWGRIRWNQVRSKAVEVLAQVGAQIDPNVKAGKLTMPQQQLVEIAKAVSVNSRVLILDEPTASLSEGETEHLFALIHRLKKQGVGVIYISHRLDELPKIADRVTALRDGVLAGTARIENATRSELIRMMVGRELSAVFPKVEVEPGKVVLDVQNLSSAVEGVRDVNLVVRAGEIVGLAGIVGAGRTELARVLFGASPATEGTIVFLGQEVKLKSPGEAAHLGIAYVPEDRRRHGVILEMSVAANSSLASLQEMSRGGFMNFAAEEKLATKFVSRMAVKTPSIDTAAGNLSGGNQQKVALARWLATEPSLLILDEPTQGIDVGSKAEIHRLMGELAAQGLAILMISSELPEIIGMSDRVYVMHGGTIVGEIDRADATQERILELAMGRSATEGVLK